MGFFLKLRLIVVVVQGKHLVIGNVGDSRAILGTKDDKGAYTAVQLTVDLKPNLPSKHQHSSKTPEFNIVGSIHVASTMERDL